MWYYGAERKLATAQAETSVDLPYEIHGSYFGQLYRGPPTDVQNLCVLQGRLHQPGHCLAHVFLQCLIAEAKKPLEKAKSCYMRLLATSISRSMLPRTTSATASAILSLERARRKECVAIAERTWSSPAEGKALEKT